MSHTRNTSLLSDLLAALGVRHTTSYNDSSFRKMTFKSLFGLSKLLETYGITSAAFVMEDRDQLDSLSVPFVAQIGHGRFVVVEEVTPSTVTVIENGTMTEMPRDEFMRRWKGLVMLVFTDEKSEEPHYAQHRFTEIATGAKRWVLAAALIVIGAYFFVVNGVWRQWPTVALTVLDLAGIYISYLLVLKTMHVSSSAADRVCSVLQEHGCDKILERKASTFYGVFGWSAVGLSYFTVSLGALLIVPESWPWLAWIGACALPFTVWSISYQKFVAKTWCTLCVTVQSLLWLEFFCFLFGGMYHNPLPVTATPVLMICCYVAALLGVDRIEQTKTSPNNA